MIIHTQRLCLRPWSDADAPALFELARDPRIGMLCGWKPFELIDDAREALSTVLVANDSYAVTLSSTGELVGSIALRVDADETATSIGNIGYWIGVPYWGNGYASEAGRAIIERAKELGVETIILKYFDGNDASRRVSEKLGFTWRNREEGVEYPLIGKRLTVHCTELALAAH
ncbi:GNAT family N-acetyltransferase [Actinomyces sp. ICM47]|uniref:GNAT family N-acetyltransferase n=1 Tax=Actinomyces sp. ICM47 TaxID=936548 RepID=UPI0025BCAE42|nr:GNAT family N-acetyltransferase [Actinomyces sp. ICM47]